MHPIVLINKEKKWYLGTKKLRYGIVNEKGDTILPCLYKSISEFSHGLAIISYRKNLFSKVKTGVINDKLQITFFKPIYDSIKILNHNLIVVGVNTKKGYLYGLIKPTGQVICKPKYKYISSFKNGLAIVEKDSGCGFINESGTQICKAKYIHAGHPIEENGAAYAMTKDYVEVQITQKGIEIPPAHNKNYI